MFKKLLVITMLSTAALAQESAKPTPGTSARKPTRTKTLTNVQFDAYLEHPEKILLLDVRRPDEVSTIGGFPVYLSIQIKDLKQHLNEIPRDRQIITVSNHAARAGAAGDQLEDAGFKVLGAIGADTYQLDGGKLAVKIPVPPPASSAAGTQPAAAAVR
jgi:rhodanese-related sulfurtransferase